MIRAVLATGALALLAAAVSVRAASPPKPAMHPAAPVTALDLIELEISYTTILARYYRPVAPAVLFDGARTGVVAEMRARGITDAQVVTAPKHIDFGNGEDLITNMVLRALITFPKKLNGTDLVGAAVAGELAQLHDPYSLRFVPEAFKKFNAFLGNAAFGGIGAVLSLDATSGRAPIERVLPGSPAEGAGLHAGDAIVAVDGAAVSTFSNAPALLAVLRGKIGTKVGLDIERAGSDSLVHLDLVRAAVRDPEVETHRFGDAAYLRLSRFGDRSAAELGSALAAARAAGATRYVLDLRGNGGGYGDEATKVASLFIKSGTIFTTLDRTTKPVVAKADGRAAFSGGLIVLVDGDTASAAEIVAGAVQDHRAGILIGARTFGKGLVQSVFPLPDGSAMKLTTARYTTPNGRDIDHIGIKPDIAVAEPAGSTFGDPDHDPQLAAALRDVAVPDSLPSPSPSPSPTAASSALPAPLTSSTPAS